MSQIREMCYIRVIAIVNANAAAMTFIAMIMFDNAPECGDLFGQRDLIFVSEKFSLDCSHLVFPISPTLPIFRRIDGQIATVAAQRQANRRRSGAATLTYLRREVRALDTPIDASPEGGLIEEIERTSPAGSRSSKVACPSVPEAAAAVPGADRSVAGSRRTALSARRPRPARTARATCRGTRSGHRSPRASRAR